MIVVTGAAGFIGSYLIHRLNQDNYNAIIAVDNFNNEASNKNLIGAKIKDRIDRDLFLNWLDTNYETVEFIFHMGAPTVTDDVNIDLLNSFNTQYSKEIWKRCYKYQLPFVYASSAATDGLGEFGFDDDESKISLLKPLNPHDASKQEFDLWALQQEEKPFFWAGLELFKVSDSNEYNTEQKVSVIYKDGEQKRDFVYVKDIAEVCLFIMHHRKNSGIYDLGSGQDVHSMI